MHLTKEQILVLKETIPETELKLPVIFNALSDSTRCRIFRLLLVTKGKDLRVTDIAHIVGVSIPAISQHMKIIENAGLVEKEKKGQVVCYRIKVDDSLVKLVVKIVKSHNH